MNKHDNIIVFQQFNNPIDANIAKAKLDAYDIPCFLTEENFTNLYPSHHLITGGIRLHVFEKDKERAHTLLLERDALENCPQCDSSNVERGLSSKPAQRVINKIAALFNSLLFPKRKISRCQNCGFEF